jgi:hypothetical protein
LFDSMAALLYRHDPIGINFDFDDNKDEYEAEARTILSRLNSCRSVDDVLQVVHEEFVRWFDRGTAGPPEHYQKIASEVWQLWEGHPHGFRPCDQTRIKTPLLVRLFFARSSPEESGR